MHNPSLPAVSIFQTIGLPTRLNLTEDDIKAAYEKTTRQSPHLEARNRLLDPVERLECWMKESDIPVSRHASIPDQLIPIFSQLSATVNEVSQLAQKREKAKSILAQSLLDKQLFESKPKLDELMDVLNHHHSYALSILPVLEIEKPSQKANALLQTLKFIRKWRQELDKAYTQLI